MKKLLAIAILLAGTLVMVSCGDDDPVQILPGAISITGIPATATIGFDGTLAVTAALTAEDGLATFTLSVDGGAASDILPAASVGQTTASVDISATADELGGVGVHTLVFVVTDADGDSEDFTHVLTISEEPVTPTVDVFASSDGVGGGAANVTWSADNIYILRGFIFVNSGQTLTIEAGTVIKGQPGQGAGASALIVAQGGRIVADGTAAAPIIFTALADDLEGSVADDAQGLWGGLIILGEGPNNADATANILSIEGIPTDEPRGQHGSATPNLMDDSGVLDYVSVRHGGSLLGSDNEINGITLGSVGAGTSITNVEVVANLDDGIEFFGGNVNVTNAIVSLCGDDPLDIDNGYSGIIQNAISWQSGDNVQSSDPTTGEWDGATGDDEGNGTDPADAKISNSTFVFTTGAGTLTQGIHMRDNFRGSVYNSIFQGAVATSAGIVIESRSGRSGNTSFQGFVDGDMEIENNLFDGYNVGGADATTIADIFTTGNDADDNGGAAGADGAELDALAAAGDNTVGTPGFGTGAARFTPTSSDDITSVETTLPTGVTAQAFKGAIAPGTADGDTFFANWTLAFDILSGN